MNGTWRVALSPLGAARLGKKVFLHKSEQNLDIERVKVVLKKTSRWN